MIVGSPMPFKDALKSREVRSFLPTTGKAADIEQLGREVRERAIFSATVSSLERLQKIDDFVNAQLTGTVDQATLRLQMKEFLQEEGYQPDPEKRGTIEDLSSTARINLQLETSVDLARGYGRWIEGQQADVLDEFPAQELFRAVEPKGGADARRPWAQIWERAGGQVTEDGRMIALKNDPIWIKISRFEQPYPPFDFGSGMDVRDETRDEAVELGLIDADTELLPQDRGFNDELKLSPEIRAESLRAVLEETGLGRFEGDVFVFDGGQA